MLVYYLEQSSQQAVVERYRLFSKLCHFLDKINRIGPLLDHCHFTASSVIFLFWLEIWCKNQLHCQFRYFLVSGWKFGAKIGFTASTLPVHCQFRYFPVSGWKFGAKIGFTASSIIFLFLVGNLVQKLASMQVTARSLPIHCFDTASSNIDFSAIIASTYVPVTQQLEKVLPKNRARATTVAAFLSGVEVM